MPMSSPQMTRMLGLVLFDVACFAIITLQIVKDWLRNYPIIFEPAVGRGETRVNLFFAVTWLFYSPGNAPWRVELSRGAVFRPYDSRRYFARRQHRALTPS